MKNAITTGHVSLSFLTVAYDRDFVNQLAAQSVVREKIIMIFNRLPDDLKERLVRRDENAISVFADIVLWFEPDLNPRSVDRYRRVAIAEHKRRNLAKTFNVNVA